MISRYIRVLSLLFIIIFSVSFSNQEDIQFVDFNSSVPLFVQTESEWVDSIFNQMTIDEKISQLFMVPAYSNLEKDHQDEVSELVKKYKVGGVIFFQGGPVRQALMTNHFQSISKTPLLVAQDCEWGLGMRLDSTISFPYQMMLGAIQNDELIYNMGQQIAYQLKRMGIHSGFSPVLDVNNNPNNPVINHRSFGENKYKVASKAYAYMSGLQDNKVLAFGKHFPGHGDTDADSHLNLPVITHDREHLYNTELYPFRHLINTGIAGIMAAHLSVTSLDSTNTPASLSSKILDELLINQMGFQGLVITDALNMEGAKSENPKAGEIEVKAIMAGNDILLMSEDVPKAIKAIKKAIRKEKISISRIENSCKKILKAKYWVGLNDYNPVEIDGLYEDLNNVKAKIINEQLIEASITIVKNDKLLIPLRSLDTLNIASISIGDVKKSSFNDKLAKYSTVKTFNLDKEFTEKDEDFILKSMNPYNLIIIGVSNTSQKSSKGYGISQQTIELIDTISKSKRVVLSLFSNPYSLSLFQDLSNISSVIVSYNDDEVIQESTVEIIFGGTAGVGRLPVSINEDLQEGFGKINYNKLRLNYSFPEAVGFDSEKLNIIDTIVANAIEEKATPGCQVLVARKGTIVFEKSYGYHTYDGKAEVKLSDLYDLASITKIAASLPCIMELYDENKLDLNKSFGDYLPQPDTSSIKDVNLQKSLCHQGQLQAWIPFYRNTLEDDKYIDGLYMNKPMPGYTTKVSDGLWILDSYRDSIYNQIYMSELRVEEEYKYSDLGYYIFQEIIEKLTSEQIEEYVQNNYYKKLGASSLGYLPLMRYRPENIVPTEDDTDFRKSMIQGYVHDPGAAMLGGVAGHAGLFSNAGDLAKMMQMYLWEGNYGGDRYFKEGTIKYFASTPYLEEENRRGIGFDKPEMDYDKVGPTFQGVSGTSFGHTGFTGTMVWVDPDKEILFVFLSNRINPDASNTKLIKMDVRTNIQEAIYNAIK